MRRLGIFLVTSLGLPALCSAATITVDSSGVAEGLDCTLELAIQSANQDTAMGGCDTGSGPDVIEFSIVGVLELEGHLPMITDDLEINGPGVDVLTVSGKGMFSMFDFNSVSGSAVRDLTLEAGSSLAVAGCVHVQTSEVTVEQVVMTSCEGANVGGALTIVSNSDVTVARTTFSGNSALSGGAIFAAGSDVIIEGTTFDGNFTSDSLGSGGAIAVSASTTVDVSRCTFHDNRSQHDGGAISIADASAELMLMSSTVVNNIADVDVSGDGDGGGLHVANGMVFVKNTIFASNDDESGAMGGVEPDVSFAGSALVVSGGYNLVGINSGGEAVFDVGNPNANQDRVGEGGAPLDPMLGPLGEFGGPTATVPSILSDLSPVIDQGSCATETVDQRGGARPIDQSPIDADDGCDIGAFELARFFADSFESGDTSAWSITMP